MVVVTVRKVGYRLVAPMLGVQPIDDESATLGEG
jgi:DNA-binding winged helix-turn-helix (wHTH) protein